MATFTTFKGVSQVGDALLNQQLEANLVEFLDWGLLNIGAFQNVRLNTTSSRLRRVEDPNFTAGKVWEPFRNNVVWETGIPYPRQPIHISGVWVNNNFYPSSTTGVYAHNFDYNLGRVVFNSVVPATSNVKLEYSYRHYSVFPGDAKWFKEIQANSINFSATQFDLYGSGIYAVLSNNRVQLPAVVVESVPRRSFRGQNLGGGQIVSQDVIFHIYADNKPDRQTIFDVITYQNEKTIKSFDVNLMADNNSFPINGSGMITSSAKNYPGLVAETGSGGYFWKNIIFKNMNGQEVQNTIPLYQAKVRTTCELIFPEI